MPKMVRSHTNTWSCTICLYIFITGCQSVVWKANLECGNGEPESCDEIIQSCCPLQAVVGRMNEGDTVYLYHAANQKLYPQVNISKSFILIANITNLSGNVTGEITLQIYGDQSGPKHVMIKDSYFQYTKLSILGFNVRIENTYFDSSVISVSSKKASMASLAIHSTVFEIENIRTFSWSDMKSQPFIQASGEWNMIVLNSVTISGSEEIQIHGMQLVDGHVKIIDVLNCTYIHLLSGISSNSEMTVDFMNVTNSQFVNGNGGLDFKPGQLSECTLSRCRLENIRDQPAVQGTIQILQIEDCKFLDNRVSENYCNGTAISISYYSQGNNMYPHQVIVKKMGSPMYQQGQKDQLYSQMPVASLVMITNSIFENNKADGINTWGEEGGYGGAVALKGDYNFIHIHQCMFSQNFGQWGGALYLEQSSKTPSNPKAPECCVLLINMLDNMLQNMDLATSFVRIYSKILLEDNLSIGDTYCNLTNSAVVQIVNSTFLSNTVERGGDGGAVAVIGHFDFIHIHRCRFSKNSGGLGGSLYFMGLSISVSESQFDENKGHKGGSLFLGEAEPIFNSFCHPVSDSPHRTLHVSLVNTSESEIHINRSECSFELIIVQSQFISNSADHGGALFVSYANDDTRMRKLTVKNCSFITNIGNAYGGAIDVSVHYYKRGDSNESSVTFLISLEGCNFDGNRAPTRGFVETTGGGAVKIEIYFVFHLLTSTSTLVRIRDCHFMNSTSTRGTLFFRYFYKRIHGQLKAHIENTSFVNNAAYFGAGIYIEHQADDVADLSLFVLIENSYFIENSADYMGGGIYYSAGRYSLDGLLSLAFIIQNCYFNKNIAKEWPGAGIALKIWESALININLQIGNTEFRQNTLHKTGRGSAVYLKNMAGKNHTVYMYVKHCLFSSNAGGDFYVINDVYFLEYASAQDAESDFLEYASAQDEESDLKKSFKSQQSALLQISIYNSSFFGTSSPESGSLYLIDESGIQSKKTWAIIIDTCQFNRYNTTNGGAFFMDLLHKSNNPAISSQIEITNSVFSENRAEQQGAAFYLNLPFTTNVIFDNCMFLQNRAQLGSGIFLRIAACICFDMPTKEVLPGMNKVIHSTFKDNINGALVVQTDCDLSVTTLTKSLFQNNMVSTAEFYAEDVHSEAELIATDVQIVKSKPHAWTTSIDVSSRAKLQLVNADILLAQNVKQLTIAHLAEYNNVNREESLSFTCPKYYRPVVTFAGFGREGASVVRFGCDLCSASYYIGNNSLTSWISSYLKWLYEDIHHPESERNCFKKSTNEQDDEAEYIFSSADEKTSVFCYTKTSEECLKCPYGGNCSHGLTPLPQYWGYKQVNGQVQFARCPQGYCCNGPLCEGEIGQCAMNRVGRLCGQCKANYSEALLSTGCIPDSDCRHAWFLPTMACWCLILVLVILFLESLKHFLVECWEMLCKRFRKSEERGMRGKGQGRKGKEGKDQGEASQEMLDNKIAERQIYMNMALRGLLKIERETELGQSRSFKYFQIAMYYLQDASLMQIALPSSYTESNLAKVRKILFDISQMAVDLLDMGLRICPISGWTPPLKLIIKSLTGPLMLLYIAVLYVLVLSLSKLFGKYGRNIKSFWYPRLATAAIFILLIFYQKMAEVTFSLLYCIESDNAWVLFLDGTVSCYQKWQIPAFIFVFIWILPLIVVLVFVPGLLEKKILTTTEFFVTCIMPFPMLLYIGFRDASGKLKHPQLDNSKPDRSQEKINELLQKSFVKINLYNSWSICWMGIIKARRLLLVIIFTYLSNQVLRLALMITATLLALILHLLVSPYKDTLANTMFSLSLLATTFIALINVLKAACVEFLLDLRKGDRTLEMLDIASDVILIWSPICTIVLIVLIHLFRKLKHCVSKLSSNWKTENKPVHTELDTA